MQPGIPGYQAPHVHPQGHGAWPPQQQFPQAPRPPQSNKKGCLIAALCVGGLLLMAGGIAAWRILAFMNDVNDGQREGADVIEPIARDFVLRSERGDWAQADMLMCKPPAARSQSKGLGPLTEPSVTIENDEIACVVYDSAVGGQPFTVEVKLRRKGKAWCVDPAIRMSCD